MAEAAAARSLLTRLPTAKLGEHLEAIRRLQPSTAEDLLAQGGQPLQTLTCAESGAAFVACASNRCGGSFRSPHSNAHQAAPAASSPSTADGRGAAPPRGRLRTLEQAANSLFAAYTSAYYGEGAVSSVYLWDLDRGFAGAVLIAKRTGGGEGEEEAAGWWDSSHVFEAEETQSEDYTYAVSATAALHLRGEHAAEDGGRGVRFELSGRVAAREATTEAAGGDDEHLRHVGDLVQAAEGQLRAAVAQVALGRVEEVAAEVRSKASLQARGAHKDLADALAAVLAPKAS